MRNHVGLLSRLGVLGLLAAATVACSSGSSPTEPKMGPTPAPAPPPTGAASVMVGGASNTFMDSQSGTSTTTINAGQTVQWTWAGGSHSTTSGNCCSASGIWDSGLKSSGTFSYTFMTAGTYPYFCTVHGSMGMTGTVVVKSTSGSGGY